METLKNKRIFVFTGGGLAPALNPTLYGVIKEAQKNKMKISGGLFGWASLLKNGRSLDLTNFNPEPLKNIGGTFLRSSRTNPIAFKNGLKMVKEKVREYRADYIVTIGGDDTLGAAYSLFCKENLKIVGLPKTIDNDLEVTYWTPGFPSAAFQTAKFCEEIKIDAAYALSRIFIIEVLGRSSGWLAASAAFGLADVIVPPEKKIKLKRLLDILGKKYEKNGNFATLVISEQANFDEDISGLAQDQKDSFKVERTSYVALSLKKKITEKLGIDCKALFPGNFLQTGPPIKIDAETAIKLGRQAINLIKEGKFGYMAALDRPSNKSIKIAVKDVPLKEAVGKEKLLDNEYFDFDNLRVKAKFIKYMEPVFGKYESKTKAYLKLINRIS